MIYAKEKPEDARRILGLEPPAIFAIGRPGSALLARHFVEK
jgi:hypothetical protein